MHLGAMFIAYIFNRFQLNNDFIKTNKIRFVGLRQTIPFVGQGKLHFRLKRNIAL